MTYWLTAAARPRILNLEDIENLFAQGGTNSNIRVDPPELARQAAPLLGHRHFGTTEKYYVQASRLEASRRVNAALKALRDGRRKEKEAGA